MHKNYFIKTSRTFTGIRKYAYLYTLLVAIGGLWYPKLGVSVLAVIGIMTAVAMFKGRYWCGNYCPHGSLFDSVMLRFSSNTKIPGFLKTRWIAIPFFLAFSYKLVSKSISISAFWGTMKFWDRLGFVFVASYLMVLIVGGLLSLFISPRSWCSFCPMGSLQKISYKLGSILHLNKATDFKVSAAHESMCHKCGKCARVCPMQLTPYTAFDENGRLNNKDCIRCSTCVFNCPASILTLKNEKRQIAAVKKIDLDGYSDRKRIAASVERIQEIDEATKEFRFRFSSPQRVDYKAGQFILVKIQDMPEMFRAYSISSANEDGTSLSVTIRRVPDGYGSAIIFDNFRVGNEVILEGPMGRELVVDQNCDKLLFIAGGIGITPFVPLVQDSLEDADKCGRKVDLVYGVNKQNEFMYDDHFDRINSETPDFNYRKVAAFDDSWNGEKGFVTDVIEKMELKGYKAYLCGPKPMIDAALPVLKKKGLSDEDIFYESA